MLWHIRTIIVSHSIPRTRVILLSSTITEIMKVLNFKMIHSKSMVDPGVKVIRKLNSRFRLNIEEVMICRSPVAQGTTPREMLLPKMI
jgi:hypothetical protein